MSISSATMERISKKECDIENQIPLVPITTGSILENSIARTQRTKRSCIKKSSTYCELLAHIKQLPPTFQTSIGESIDKEIKEWETAITNSDYEEVQTLFTKLSQTFTQECEAPELPIFHCENVTCWGFSTSSIDRSFTEEFTLHLRTILKTNDLEKTKDLAYIFKKWRLYFSHLNESADTQSNIKFLKESALALSPLPFPVVTVVAALKNYPTLSYVGIGLTIAGLAATQVAIRKFGILSAHKQVCIGEEIAKVHSSIAHFEHALTLQKTKLRCTQKMQSAVTEYNIKEPFHADLTKKLKEFHSLCDEASRAYPSTNFAALKTHTKVIIDSLHPTNNNKDPN